MRRRKLEIFADWLSVEAGTLIALMLRFAITVRFLPLTQSNLGSYLVSPTLIAELIGLPLGMMALYWLTGYYTSRLVESSRMRIIGNTLLCALIGSVVFFLAVALNDHLPRRRYAFEVFGFIFGGLTLLPLLQRMAFARYYSRRYRRRLYLRPAVIIGRSREAYELKRRIEQSVGSMGFKIVRVLAPGDDAALEEMLQRGDVDCVICTPESQGCPLPVKFLGLMVSRGISLYVSQDMRSPLTRRISINNVTVEPLTEVTRPRLSPATHNIKRASDVLLSALSLLLLSPVLVVVAAAIKATSPGPVFYRQSRLGLHRKPFDIVKFRTMRVDAEPEGPALTVADDPRVTPIGRFLRKYRIDELPNFWNVLRGDMSLVGPRPEREHFVSLIQQKAPAYALLHTVRPGITSWGMVRFGYAQNVEEMTERMRYDLLYLDNISLSVDMKILFHTVRTVITGRGQ